MSTLRVASGVASTRKRMAIKLLWCALAIYMGVFLVLALMQRTFMYHPTRGEESEFLALLRNTEWCRGAIAKARSSVGNERGKSQRKTEYSFCTATAGMLSHARIYGRAGHAGKGQNMGLLLSGVSRLRLAHR
jgi:hypothetical protein